ncbi:MAG TPA: hypothetical protein VL359_06090, partial [bacterium]|nr:hypothetical protein [bacterium]
AYNQGPVLALMHEAYAHDGRLATVDVVSYALLFYGGRPVNMIGTYKFTGDPAALDHPGDAPLYVIAPLSRGPALLKAHPLLQPVRQEADLGLWVLPASRG